MGNALAFGAYRYLDRDSLVGCRLPFFVSEFQPIKSPPGVQFQAAEPKRR